MNSEKQESNPLESTSPITNPEPIGADINNQPRDGFRGIITTVLLFVAALVVAFLLTAFVFQQYEVDGPSMESTLQNQDRLIVVKLPKSWSELTGHPYIPTRGTIIVFNEGGLYNAEGVQEKQLIKRVIGLPGDRVVVANNVVTIYNKQHPNGFDPDKTMSYGKVITYTSGNIDVVVQPNNVFVMGDNRPDSLDSRYFGQVPVKNIIGKLNLRIYPFNTINIF